MEQCISEKSEQNEWEYQVCLIESDIKKLNVKIKKIVCMQRPVTARAQWIT